MKSLTFYKFLFFLLLLFAGWGCRESPLKLSVHYDSLSDLSSDGPVYFQKKQVGHIERVMSTEQGGYLVKIAIEPEFKSEMTESSRFFISYDPYETDKTALLIEQESTGGALLKNGTVIEGEKRLGLINRFMSGLDKAKDETAVSLQGTIASLKSSWNQSSERLSAEMQSSLDDIDSYLRELEESLSATSDDELDNLQQSLDDFIKEFKQAEREVQERIRTEVIPELQRQLETLKKQMKAERREEEIRGIETRLDRIRSV